MVALLTCKGFASVTSLALLILVGSLHSRRLVSDIKIVQHERYLQQHNSTITTTKPKSNTTTTRASANGTLIQQTATSSSSDERFFNDKNNQKNHATTNYPFPMSAEAWLNDLDTSRIACGYWKCYFPSKANPQHGWLVAPASGNLKMGGFNVSDAILGGWNLAKELESEHHIQHFLLEPPREFASWKLQTELYERNKHVQDLFSEKWDMAFASFSNTTTTTTSAVMPRVIAQKVQQAPKSSKLRKGCCGNNAWLDMKQSVKKSPHPHEFALQFASNLQEFYAITKEYPKFVADCQYYLNDNGSIYHVDFDRVFQLGDKASTQEYWNLCQEKLPKFVRRLEEMASNFESKKRQ